MRIKEKKKKGKKKYLKKKIANFKDLLMGSELAITTLDRGAGVITDNTVNMPAWCSVVVKKWLECWEWWEKK